MISDVLKIRPRYGEVDQMGYVYHANYVTYCHQARTELLRKFGVNDKELEDKEIMMPVISMNLNYKKPAHYDEELCIKTTIRELPKVRFNFEFEISNTQSELICLAQSTVVFVRVTSRFPIQVPEFILNALQNKINPVANEI